MGNDFKGLESNVDTILSRRWDSYILSVDLTRIFSSQKALNKAIKEMVNPRFRRRISQRSWDYIVVPLIKKNDLELEFYRDKDGYLYHISEQK